MTVIAFFLGYCARDFCLLLWHWWMSREPRRVEQRSYFRPCRDCSLPQ